MGNALLNLFRSRSFLGDRFSAVRGETDMILEKQFAYYYSPARVQWSGLLALATAHTRKLTLPWIFRGENLANTRYPTLLLTLSSRRSVRWIFAGRISGSHGISQCSFATLAGPDRLFGCSGSRCTDPYAAEGVPRHCRSLKGSHWDGGVGGLPYWLRREQLRNGELQGSILGYTQWGQPLRVHYSALRPMQQDVGSYV